MSDFAVLTLVPLRELGQPLVDFLGEHGISASIKSDDCGGLDPALNFSNGTRVIVPRSDLEQAKMLLAEFETAPVIES